MTYLNSSEATVLPFRGAKVWTQVNKNFCKITTGGWKLVNLKCLASARSKGERLVSAKAPIKNIINTGNKGIINHIDFWDSTISVKFKLPVNRIISNIAELNINS